MTNTTLAALDLPVVVLEEIFHVGTFQGYTPRFRSHEANALSASTCPEAWRQIARIGDAPTWRLTKPGARFLDAFALTPDQQMALDAHAVALGLAARAPEWRLWSSDCETDARTYMVFASEAEIRHELGCATGDPLPIDAPDEEDCQVECVAGLAATSALRARLGIPEHDQVIGDHAQDLCLQAIAEDAGLDGVLFDERYDPIALSAPRIAVHQARVATFAPERLPADPDDDPAAAARAPRSRVPLALTTPA